MARFARQREPRTDVIRVRGAIVIRSVTRHAVRRPSRIGAAGVTGAAAGHDVRSNQRPDRVRVPEIGPARVRVAMARVAREREPRRGVSGIGGSVVVAAMATDAVAGSTGVDAAAVTRPAGLGRVDACQGECGVIESRLSPGRVSRTVAELAGHRESGRAMERLARPVVVGRVARRAVAEGPAEIAVMALIAGERPVRAGERERRARAVVPGHRGPRRRSMTILTFIAEARSIDVVLPAHPVAVVAARRRPFDDAVDVAVPAGRDEMASLEGEESRFVERARGIRPGGVDLMAVRTRRTELATVRILVTRDARAEVREADCPAHPLVACAALRRCVFSAKERTRIAMRVALDAERIDRMATLTCRIELSLMRVLVTGGTRGGGAAIDGPRGALRMALRTWHRRMFPGQWKRRLRVIESLRRELRRFDGVAVGAPRKLPVVHVAVARHTFGRQVPVHARLDRSAVTLIAFHRRMLPAEELCEARVLVSRDSERLRGVALLASCPQLGVVRVLVAGHARGGQSPKIAGALVTRRACRRPMLPLQRKLRLRRMIEGRSAEAVLVVTRRTVLPERAAVRIFVARGARPQLQASLGRRADVALPTREIPMPPRQRRPGFRVIEARDLPARRGVAGAAVVADVRLVRALVAVGARRVTDALVLALRVTFRAGHIAMRALEREGGLRVIERARRLLERSRCRMAARAVAAKTAVVRVLVTGAALRAQCQVRARHVTLRAFQRRMAAVE